MGNSSSNSNNDGNNDKDKEKRIKPSPKTTSRKKTERSEEQTTESTTRTTPTAAATSALPERKSPRMSEKFDKMKELEEARAIVDAIVVEDDEAVREARREELKRTWMRDELYSPVWLFSMVRRHDLVTEEDMKILMDNEYDVFLIKKFGEDKLKELGISEKSRKNLIQLADGM